MIFSKFTVIALITLLLSISVYSQTNLGLDASAIKKKRTERIKADILRELQSFQPKDQAYYYASLGDIFCDNDQKEVGLSLLKKAVEIGTNPATVYKDNWEKLDSLISLLYNVLENDAVLADRIISKIKEIQIDESNLEQLEDANKTYISLAEQILTRKQDYKAALDFAMLSLKEPKPAINWNSTEFYWKLKFHNVELANVYFIKLFEIVKNKQGIALYSFGKLIDKGLLIKEKSLDVSDSQKKEFLEIFLPLIQKETEELILKKSDNCFTTINYGIKYFSEYKRLFPEKLPIIERAINVCQNAEIEKWKKPELNKTPPKTSQDYLNLANEMSNKKTKSDYLRVAASKTLREKKYQLGLRDSPKSLKPV